MNYQIYRLEFQTAVHFGMGSLETTGASLNADTVFSALCLEALHDGEAGLNDLVRKAREGHILISDAFPYMRKELYLPKPMRVIETGQRDGDSVSKKRFKQLQYIPVSLWDEYFQGKFPIERATDLRQLGTRTMKVSAAVRGREETLPYRIETFRFADECGLYMIAGYDGAEDKAQIDRLMEMLSLSGIGGKRSSGMGRFQCRIGKVPELLLRKLEQKADHFMTLSVSLPADAEMEKALEGASYQLLRRSGFVLSETYAEEQMRKRDLYVFAAGSCFRNRFGGDVFDVSEGGRHPVYRYAKPLFMGVDR